jgi:hypothetical protein
MNSTAILKRQLAKGTIPGATIPWEVAPSLKVQELVKNHTTFAGKQGLYTQTFAELIAEARTLIDRYNK